MYTAQVTAYPTSN